MVGIVLRIALFFSIVALVACNASPQVPARDSQVDGAPTEVLASAADQQVEEDTPTPSRSPTALSTATPRPMSTAIPKLAAQNLPLSGPTPGGPIAPLIVKGNIGKPFVSLTFDSGAAAGSTAEILNILRDNGIHTTFFITGAWAEANPALVKRIVAEGHRIGNHSFTHPDMTKVGDDVIASELSRTEATIKRIAGVSTKPYFRPPFGAYDKRVLRVLAREGYKAIYWTVDSTDWRDDSTVDSVVKRVVGNAGAGAIVVHHSSPAKTAKALPAEIRQLRAKGLKIVNLPQLLGE